jgi:AP2-like factor, euAP2 lineage
MKEIALTKEKIAYVDDDDYDRIQQYSWAAVDNKHTWYAKGVWKDASGNRKLIYMHRFILDAPPEKCVDYIDHNGLNNQKSNLRLCSYSENMRNLRSKRGVSKYKGVYLNPTNNRWFAQIRDGKGFALGTYDSEEDAARAYNIAAKQIFGEFAFLNDIPDSLRPPQARILTSKYLGVCWYKRTKRWKGKIVQDGKQFHLGYFFDEIEAARAYDEAAKKLFGDEAQLNFPDVALDKTSTEAVCRNLREGNA